jgi:hypothetical protein
VTKKHTFLLHQQRLEIQIPFFTLSLLSPLLSLSLSKNWHSLFFSHQFAKNHSYCDCFLKYFFSWVHPEMASSIDLIEFVFFLLLCLVINAIIIFIIDNPDFTCTIFIFLF